MITLAPRLEGHAARRYVGFAGVVLELVHEGHSILDALRYSYLALLERGNGREHEVLLWHRPITVRALWPLQLRL